MIGRQRAEISLHAAQLLFFTTSDFPFHFCLNIAALRRHKRLIGSLVRNEKVDEVC